MVSPDAARVTASPIVRHGVDGVTQSAASSPVGATYQVVGSSSVIVSSAELGVARLAPIAPLSARFTVSSPSQVASSTIPTVKVFATASPFAKLIVPEVAV